MLLLAILERCFNFWFYIKIDGVGPVDKRPYQLAPTVCKKSKKSNEKFEVTFSVKYIGE